MLTPATLTARDLERILADAIASGGDGSAAALAVERETLAHGGAVAVQHYILRDREPAPTSLEDYVAWRKTAGWPCRIAAAEAGFSFVSTEFLGADSRPDPKGAPVLFQTVVCSEDQDFDGLLWNARAYDEALALHARVVAALAGGSDAVAALLDELPA